MNSSNQLTNQLTKQFSDFAKTTTLRKYISLTQEASSLRDQTHNIFIPDDYYCLSNALRKINLSYTKQSESQSELQKLRLNSKGQPSTNNHSSVIVAVNFHDAVTLLCWCRHWFPMCNTFLQTISSSTNFGDLRPNLEINEGSIRKLFSVIRRFFRWINHNIDRTLDELAKKLTKFYQPLDMTIQEKSGFQPILVDWNIHVIYNNEFKEQVEVTGYYHDELLEDNYQEKYSPVTVWIDKIQFNTNKLFGDYLTVRVIKSPNDVLSPKESSLILPLSTIKNNIMGFNCVTFVNRRNQGFNYFLDTELDSYKHASLLDDWSIEGHWDGKDTRYYLKGTEYNLTTWNPWNNEKAPMVETSNIVSIIFGNKCDIFEKPHMIVKTIQGNFYKLQYCDQYYKNEYIRVA